MTQSIPLAHQDTERDLSPSRTMDGEVAQVDALDVDGDLTAWLCRKFIANQFWAFCGPGLLYIHPFSSTSSSASKSHVQVDRSDDDLTVPSTSSLALRVHQAIQKDSSPQSVIVVGEHGCGARAIVDELLSSLYSLAHPEPGLITATREANVVLHVFTCTVHENMASCSSSAEVCELSFDCNGKLVGACLARPLLDLSYLPHPSSLNGGFFHILHLLAADLPRVDAHLASSLHILPYDQYKLLKERPINRMEHELSTLMDSMAALQIPTQATMGIFRLLSAILLLGNVEFHPRADEMGTILATPHLLDPISDLLDLGDGGSTALGDALCTQRSPEEAATCRDALLKFLYLTAVSNLERAVNESLRRVMTERKAYASLMIVYHPGFQMGENNISVRNGIGTLLSNYVGERLLDLIIRGVFMAEEAAMRRDGVQCGPTYYPDNARSLELFLGENGLLCELSGKAQIHTVATFVRCMIQCHPHNALLKVAGVGEMSIVHSAGNINLSYDIGRLLRENREWPGDDLVRLVTSGQTSLHSIATMGQTAVDRFHMEASMLVQDLSVCEMSCILCLRSNSSQTPNRFDNKWMIRQLREWGVDVLCSQKKNIFPVAMTFADFLHRLSIPCCEAAPTQNRSTFISLIVKVLGDSLDPEQYEVGNGMIFVKRSAFLRILHSRKEQHPSSCILSEPQTSPRTASTLFVPENVFLPSPQEGGSESPLPRWSREVRSARSNEPRCSECGKFGNYVCSVECKLNLLARIRAAEEEVEPNNEADNKALDTLCQTHVLLAQGSSALVLASLAGNYTLASLLARAMDRVTRECGGLCVPTQRDEKIAVRELGPLLASFPSASLHGAQGAVAPFPVDHRTVSGGSYVELCRLQHFVDSFMEGTESVARAQEPQVTEFVRLARDRVEHELCTPSHHKHPTFMSHLVRALTTLCGLSPASVRILLESGICELLIVMLNSTDLNAELQCTLAMFIDVLARSDEGVPWFVSGNGLRVMFQVLHRGVETVGLASSKEELLTTIYLLEALLHLTTHQAIVSVLEQVLPNHLQQKISVPRLLIRHLNIHTDRNVKLFVIQILGNVSEVYATTGDYGRHQVVRALVRLFGSGSAEFIQHSGNTLNQCISTCKTNHVEDQLDGACALLIRNLVASDNDHLFVASAEALVTLVTKSAKCRRRTEDILDRYGREFVFQYVANHTTSNLEALKKWREYCIKGGTQGPLQSILAKCDRDLKRLNLSWSPGVVSHHKIDKEARENSRLSAAGVMVD